MKQKKKKPRKFQGGPSGPAKKTEEGHHLDETITTLASSTGTSLRSHWKTLVATLTVVGLVVAGYVIVEAIAEARENSLSDSLYDLTRSPAAMSEAVPDGDKFRELIADVKGARAEKSVFKISVQYLLDRADQLADMAAAKDKAEPGTDEFDVSDILGGDSGGAGSSEPDDPGKAREELMELVMFIVGEGRRRFSDDEEMAQWISNVDKRVTAENDKSWLHKAREYEIHLPGSAPPESPPSDSGSDSLDDKAGTAGESGEPATPPTDSTAEKQESPDR